MHWLALILALAWPGWGRTAGRQGSAEPPPLLLRTELRPDGAVWVGERTSFYVTVLMRERPEYTPRFDPPLVDGAFFFRAPGSPLLGTERVNGVEYTTQRVELMLFPQRAGTVEIPAVTLRVGIGGREHRASTEPASVTVRQPDGVPVGAALITSTAVEISESWSPSPGPAVAGDAFERRVTLQATNVMGLALPPLPMPDVDGLALYPAEPSVQDVLQRGALRTTRVDSLTLVCERAGTLVIPPLLYRWWNPEARRVEEKILPAVTLEVEPAPARALEDADASDRQGTLWLMAGGLALAAGLLALTRRALARRWDAWRRARAEREAAAFGRLIAACEGSDPRAAWGALTAWTDKVQDRRAHGDRAGATVRELGVALGNPAFVHESEQLQRALVDPRVSWSARELVGALHSLRRDLRGKRRRGGDLRPLNPGH